MLMDTCLEMVSRLAFRMLCDHSDSEYVTGMVMQELTRNSNSHRGDMHDWLLQQTVRFTRKRYRHNRFMSFLGKRPRIYVQTAPKVDDVDDYITTQAWEIYCRASEEMPIEQRIVYVLIEMEGLSEDDVMHVTGFWRGAVRMSVEIARTNVKAELSRFGKVAEYEAYVGFLKRVKDSQWSCPVKLNSLSLRCQNVKEYEKTIDGACPFSSDCPMGSERSNETRCDSRT